MNRNYEKHRRKRSSSPHSTSKRLHSFPPQAHSSASSRQNDQESSSFSYRNYKYELEKVLSRKKLVDLHDLNDFWLFVDKYETLKSRNVESKLKTVGDTFKMNYNDLVPKKINETFEEKLSILNEEEKLYSYLPFDSFNYERKAKLTFKQFSDFLIVLRLYYNFKYRETSNKIQKLQASRQALPIAQYRDQIVSTLQNEQIVIIAGDTGCGKSTQVPQYLLEAGFNNIVCTQPRRIACISLAKRVAHEMLVEDGQLVGYQIRFEKRKNKNTQILFITEGLLLRQISSESADDYEVVVLDEIHERHLHGDFLLGVTKCLIHQKPKLKLVLMSATINIELFQDYFSNESAKIIQVPGRLHPITLHYRPIVKELKQSKSERLDARPYLQIMRMIDEKYPENEKGDLLIFLSGMAEITSVVEAASEYAEQTKKWIILSLHSSLSLAEQDKVFDYPPEGVRKCIVSTNIAETSVTIDGIRFVADSGKVKEMSYDPACRMKRLKEFWISRASAEQRKGRAGRTGPGVCYRLYSEEDYQTLDPYSTPEIQRVPLDSLVLQMMAMGLSDPRKFPFIEAPAKESIENAIISLKHHAAITNEENLTPIGRALARLPVDIIVGKMLIIGCVFYQVEPVLSLAAALSVQNPFTNRAYVDKDCQAARKSFESDHGDPVTLLHAYREWLEIKRDGKNGESRTWCRRRGLEEQRFYEITKLRSQFKDLLQDCSLLEISEPEAQTSAERAIRHGELRQLRELRKTHRQSSHGKRKQLKLEEFEINNPFEIDKKTDEIDIKDVEFRLSHDSSKVEKLLSGATACTYKDLTILKLILTSGLYPQIAVPDEFNYCKSTSEQLFHTKNKAFIALHPLTYFGNHAEILQLQEFEIDVPPNGYFSKRPFSSKHQLLCFLTLLETTKPYLLNTIRMPTAQTLLLFANTIETNSTFTQIVCDSWILLEFPVPETGQTLLLRAAKLRKQWNQALANKLQSTRENAEEELKKNKPKSARSEFDFDLEQNLISFIRSEVGYTVNRLLPADLKTIYVGLGENCETIDPNPFDDDFECIEYKRGGMQCAPHIFYNCLVDKEWASNLAMELMQNAWICNRCSQQLYLTSIQKLQHLNICDKTIESQTIVTSNSASGSNTKAYECQLCNKTLYLTSIEILKHKKGHRS